MDPVFVTTNVIGVPAGTVIAAGSMRIVSASVTSIRVLGAVAPAVGDTDAAAAGADGAVDAALGFDEFEPAHAAIASDARAKNATIRITFICVFPLSAKDGLVRHGRH